MCDVLFHDKFQLHYGLVSASVAGYADNNVSVINLLPAMLLQTFFTY